MEFLTGESAVAMHDGGRGANVIGGCCRVTHQQIAEFKKALVDEKKDFSVYDKMQKGESRWHPYSTLGSNQD